MARRTFDFTAFQLKKREKYTSYLHVFIGVFLGACVFITAVLSATGVIDSSYYGLFLVFGIGFVIVWQALRAIRNPGSIYDSQELQFPILPVSAKRMKRFANQNNLHFGRQPAQLQFESEFPPIISRGLHRIYFDYSVSGLLDDVAFEFSRIDLVGAPADMTQTKMLLNIDLPFLIPHIVIDGFDNKTTSVSDIPFYFDSESEIELEGDFPDHYRVYAKKGYEVDVLTILSPEVMETLRYAKGRHNIEIIGNQIYIYMQEVSDHSEVENVFAMAAALSRQLLRKGDTWSYRQDGEIAQISGETYNRNIEIFNHNYSIRLVSYFILILIAVAITLWGLYAEVGMIVILGVLLGYTFYSLYKTMVMNNKI